MKTKIEVLGYEIEIEEVDGQVTVKAEFDGETVEEFTLEAQDAQGDDDDHEGDAQGDDEVKGFGDFDGQKEEEDFEDGDFGDDDDAQDEAQDDDDDKEESGRDEVKLESFSSFINK